MAASDELPTGNQPLLSNTMPFRHPIPKIAGMSDEEDFNLLPPPPESVEEYLSERDQTFPVTLEGLIAEFLFCLWVKLLDFLLKPTRWTLRVTPLMLTYDIIRRSEQDQTLNTILSTRRKELTNDVRDARAKIRRLNHDPTLYAGPVAWWRNTKPVHRI